MADTKKQERVLAVFENISDSYDRANDRISLGFQKSWKDMLIRRIGKDVPKDGKFLDVCCGSGDIALKTAAARPDLAVTGLDFSPAMLRTAGRRLDEQKADPRGGIPNVRFVQGDAMELPFEEESFSGSGISFGLRNTADYGRVIREMKRVTEKGGMIYCLDSFVPDSRLVRPFYRLYFRFVMPLLGGGRRFHKEYMWLYRSTQEFLSRREAEELFRSCGLTQVTSRCRMFGACVLVSGRKADS